MLPRHSRAVLRACAQRVAAQQHARAQSSFFPVQSRPTSATPVDAPPKPPSAFWFTARPAFNQVVDSLEKSVTTVRSHLWKLGILKSVKAPINARGEFGDSLAHPRERKWRPIESMSAYVRNGNQLKSSQYIRITTLLSELEGLLPYATIADEMSIAIPKLTTDPMQPELTGEYESMEGQLRALLDRFTYSTTTSTAAGIARVTGKDRRLGSLDEHGRVFAIGRRKESSAAVWILPTQSDDKIGQILVNNKPIESYFAYEPTRKASLRALELTDTKGAFNVFAIVNGGGLSSKADALAMGTARALVEWERQSLTRRNLDVEDSEWRPLLKRADLLERDPRMVERKKTGQVKARKKFTWVKR